MASELEPQPLTPSFEAPPLSLELDGPRVSLRPFGAADADALFAISHPADHEARERHWRFMPYGPFESADALRELYLSNNRTRPAHMLALVVFDKVSQSLAGVVHFMNVVPANRVLELGGIWYGDAFKRTHVNTEATRLSSG
eukprot:a852693_3.p1 GENE.a852693_3~~a852693_3.p1  ORF type:complete len:151 (+),score=46.31 a852693_3:28-453(+)